MVIVLSGGAPFGTVCNSNWFGVLFGSMQEVMSLFVGVGLAAACGFRIFVPLLAMSVAALSGHLTLGPSFQWIGSYPALIAFSAATVLEITAYYVPWLDN